MRRLLCWQVSVLLLLAAMPAGAQAPSQDVQSSGDSLKASSKSAVASQTTSESALNPGVTITGKPLHSEARLPTLPGREFMNCASMSGGGLSAWEECVLKMNLERSIVLRACVDGKAEPRRVMNAPCAARAC